MCHFEYTSFARSNSLKEAMHLPKNYFEPRVLPRAQISYAYDVADHKSTKLFNTEIAASDTSVAISGPINSLESDVTGRRSLCVDYLGVILMV